MNTDPATTTSTSDASGPPPFGLAPLVDRIAGIATAVAALSLLGLVVVQGWQVFARYVLNNSPGWTEPVTVLLLSTAMSLGAAAGVHSGRHFGFFLLGEAVGPRAKRAMDAIALLAMIVIGLALAWWGGLLLADGFDIRMAGAPLPQSIAYLPLSVGGALMVLFAGYRLRRLFRPDPTAEDR